MNQPYDTLSLEARARVRADAVETAHALRQEAFDDFWRGANHLLGSAAVQAQRSTTRLLHRLQRRDLAVASR